MIRLTDCLDMTILLGQTNLGKPGLDWANSVVLDHTAGTDWSRQTVPAV